MQFSERTYGESETSYSKHLIEKGPNFFELFEGFIFNIFI